MIAENLEMFTFVMVPIILFTVVGFFCLQYMYYCIGQKRSFSRLLCIGFFCLPVVICFGQKDMAFPHQVLFIFCFASASNNVIILWKFTNMLLLLLMCT